MSVPSASNDRVSPGLGRAALTGLLAELDRDLALAGKQRAMEAVAPSLRELRSDLDAEIDRASSAAVICLVGATGAGKSTLLNALVGREVAVEGVNRPTTSAPVIYRPSDADVGALVEGLPGDPPKVVTYEAGVDAGLAGERSFWRGQILIDAPDTNSVATVHRDVVKMLSARADVLVVVAHRQSVAELSSATFIDLFAERRGMVFVLGRADELDERSVGELSEQLRTLRNERWRSPDAPVVAISARAAREAPGTGNLAELQSALTELIAAEKLGSVRRRNAIGTVAHMARLVQEAQGSSGGGGGVETLDGALQDGAVHWCGGLVAATGERLDVRRADLARMLWNDAAKLWDGPGGYALKVGGLSALGMGAGAAVARRNPVLAAGLAVGSVAADRMRVAVRERQFESTSGLLPGAAELEALQRDAFLEARLAAEDAFVDGAADGLAMAPGSDELDAHAVRAVDDAWDRLLRVDLPREAARAVSKALRLLIDLPVYALGLWVLVRVGLGFFRDSYVGVDFLVSAAIIALAWLFFARMLVRARLGSRSAALVASVRGDIEQRIGSAAQGAIDQRLHRLVKSREALARLASLDALWRERLHGERSAPPARP